MLAFGLWIGYFFGIRAIIVLTGLYFWFIFPRILWLLNYDSDDANYVRREKCWQDIRTGMLVGFIFFVPLGMWASSVHYNQVLILENIERWWRILYPHLVRIQ